LITNMTDWGPSGLYGTSRGILKHWYSKKEKKYISLDCLFKNGEGFIPYESPVWIDMKNLSSNIDDYILIENSEDEIKDAVIEYFGVLDSNDYSPSPLQSKFSMYRKKHVYNTNLEFEKNAYTYNSDKRRLIDKYYFSIRTEISNGLISNCFLSKNFKYNIRNDD